MQTIFDIAVYFAFAAAMAMFANRSDRYILATHRNPATTWDRNLIYYVAFYTILAMFRCHVGVDNLSYARIFQDANSTSEYEHIWNLFVNACGVFNWTIPMGICAFIQILCITKAAMRWRWMLIFIPFVLFGGRYFMDMANAVRQMTVACVFLWGLRFVYERKPLPFFTIIILGMWVHQSAILMIPVYFLPRHFHCEQRRILLLGILGLCVVIGQLPLFSNFLNALTLITEATDYDRYEGIMTEIVERKEMVDAMKFGPMMATYLLIPVFQIWFGPSLRREYAGKVRMFDIWNNLSILYAFLFFLVCNVNHLFIRPIMYLSLPQMMMAALMLRWFVLRYKDHRQYGLAALAFCLVIFTNTAWQVAKSQGQQYEAVTYKTVFTHPELLKLTGVHPLF